jgi:O-antigen ligase
MTNSVYIGFSIILVVIAMVLMLGGDQVRSGTFGLVVSTFLVVAVAASVLILTNSFQTRSQAVALFSNYKETAAETGVAASRDDVWQASIDSIRRYPLFGARFSNGQETMPATYAAKGYFLSHNIFLDYGRSSGIPGMILLALFFFWPAFLANRHGRWLSFLPFLMAHLGFLIFFLSLSFFSYKAFWGFWMLMMLATSRAQFTTTRSIAPRYANPRSKADKKASSITL